MYPCTQKQIKLLGFKHSQRGGKFCSQETKTGKIKFKKKNKDADKKILLFDAMDPSIHDKANAMGMYCRFGGR